jgi:uncharacterized protein YndB with AHSA1/START domain
MPDFTHHVDRTIVIRARPETVFGFFEDNDRWASWWGAGSTIDPKPGGRVYILHPGRVEIEGEVLEVAPPRRFVFTYGYVAGAPIPAGGSRVTIRLDAIPTGTKLHLTHEFTEAASRNVAEDFVQGWRYQLSVFANVVAAAIHTNAADAIDHWFAAWSEPDQSTREREVAALASPAVQFRDRFSLVEGLDDLLPHLVAVHRFMPGMRIARQGDVQQSHGMAIAPWVARSADGQERGKGTNVFTFDQDGRIETVTGFWA